MSYISHIRSLLEETGYQDSFTDWEDIFERAVTNTLEDTYRLPLFEGESAVIAPGNEKAAALCYDRVWGVEIPEIGFVGRSYAEVAMIMARMLSDRYGKQSPQINFEMAVLMAGIERNTFKSGDTILNCRKGGHWF